MLKPVIIVKQPGQTFLNLLQILHDYQNLLNLMLILELRINYQSEEENRDSHISNWLLSSDKELFTIFETLNYISLVLDDYIYLFIFLAYNVS